MRVSFSGIVVALVNLHLVSAELHEVWWNITYTNANPDGLFDRQVIGINGSWPPPPIEVTVNDTLRVHAFNSLDVPTSLHHHGQFFNSSSYNDGAVGVTQCGIPPGQSYTYEVPMNVSGQWGTYWVHAHATGQYVDGLRAPVVIHRNPDFVTSTGADHSKFATPPPPSVPEPYAYDEEYTVILSDWYHEQHSVLLAQFISQANPGGAEPVPDSAIMYFSQNGVGDATPTAVGFNENSTLPFQPGKTYRLRVINQSAFSMFFFWIEGHDMRVIEVDGTDVEEFQTDIVTITVAQRYSVLVTALNDTSQNFVIHANMDTDMFDTVPDALQPNITSSITYNNSAPFATTDNATVDTYPQFPDILLVPLEIIPEIPASVQHALTVSFDTMTDGTNRAMFNNITYNAPLVPALFSELTLGGNASVQAAYGPSAIVLDHLDVVELTVTNLDAGKHPFHLHGHKFAIINRVADITSDDPSQNPPVTEGQANPMRRDTIEIPSGGSVTLRWVADNPGAWFFHCHIDWHLSAGLAVVFLEAPLLAQSVTHPPQYAYDQCQTLGQPISGNAAGHASTTDLTGLTLGPFLQNNGWHGRGIGAMFGCVLTAVLGMASVIWYALGGNISDEEMEHEARQQVYEKERRGGKFGVVKRLFKAKN
ncbi:Fet3 protein [Sistotremastrum niveocremeum HHB9708]|uniref:Fet3 protein n=1 Tax=Sistotremastrum niveocremeum HHB9708 TaxID=1314777 RepID=A0A164Z274_9AGAM|nr:Fet3 protein [Sistotremastrum niveocremeum HHB9708]